MLLDVSIFGCGLDVEGFVNIIARIFGLVGC